MPKSYKDVSQEFSKTGLGIPLKIKNHLSRTPIPFAEWSFGFKPRERWVPA